MESAAVPAPDAAAREAGSHPGVEDKGLKKNTIGWTIVAAEVVR